MFNNSLRYLFSYFITLLTYLLYLLSYFLTYFTYLLTYLLYFSILEISKLIMNQFYYDYLKPKYGDKCTLLFTDTDSFCCHIQTEDLYPDMSQNLDLFDTSLNVYSKIQYYVKSLT